MDLQVCFYEDSEIENDPVLDKWVACGSNASNASDLSYEWYSVAACATSGEDSLQTCIKDVGMPLSKRQTIEDCMAGPAAHKLVEKMHKRCAAPGISFFPAAAVDSVMLPENKMNSDDIWPLVKAVCGKAADLGSLLPPVCGNLSRSSSVAPSE